MHVRGASILMLVDERCMMCMGNELSSVPHFNEKIDAEQS